MVKVDNIPFIRVILGVLRVGSRKGRPMSSNCFNLITCSIDSNLLHSFQTQGKHNKICNELDYYKMR